MSWPRRIKNGDWGSARWALWNSSVGTQDEVDAEKDGLLLADHAEGLLRVLQGLPRLSEVWQRTKCSSITASSDHQTLAI